MDARSNTPKKGRKAQHILLAQTVSQQRTQTAFRTCMVDKKATRDDATVSLEQDTHAPHTYTRPHKYTQTIRAE